MANNKKKYNVYVLLGTIAITCLALFAGLWPFSFFVDNHANYNVTTGCLQCDRYSYAYVPIHHDKITHDNELSFTLKTSLTFDPRTKYPYIARLITFYDKRNNVESIVIGQWNDGLVVRVHKTTLQTGHSFIAEQGIDSFFLGKNRNVLSVEIDSARVRVLADQKVLKFNNAVLPDSLIMVIGNSPWGDAPWNGLACLAVNENYFKIGDSLAGIKGGAPKLVIPKHFRPIARMVVTPMWHDFTVDFSYMADVAVNFIGFLPFGFLWAMFFYTLLGTKKFRAVTIAIMAGFATSMTIELIQVYLPYRTSQMSDVVFNTLGSAVGAMAFIFWKTLRQRFISDAI